MTKLEKIVKEAQKIRKAHPKKYAKWTDYIKAASKSIAGYVGTKKTATTTTVNYTRKVAAKKAKPATQAKLFGNKTHKDTKSHNVNIRVVSGSFSMSQISQLQKRIDSNIRTIDSMKDLSRRKGVLALDKNKIISNIKDLQKENSEFKKIITILKKTIK